MLSQRIAGDPCNKNNVSIGPLKWKGQYHENRKNVWVPFCGGRPKDDQDDGENKGLGSHLVSD